MMLSLSVFYNIPQCNFKLFFLLRPDQCLGGLCGSSAASTSATAAGGSGSHQLFRNEEDSERIRLQTAGAPTGPRYTQHLENPDVSVQEKGMVGLLYHSTLVLCAMVRL